MKSSKSTTTELYHFLATGFYSGLSPKAPGTAGTLAAAAIYFGLIRLTGTDPSAEIIFLAAWVIFFVGVYVLNYLQARSFYGAGVKDPQCVVIDEFAGYFLTLAGHGNSTASIFLAFVAFRLFDITKIPPIKRLEKLPSGWGIMADDMFAGVYASMLLYLLGYFY